MAQAIDTENRDLIELFLKRGTNPNILCNGQAPLHTAILNGKRYLIGLLLGAAKQKTDLNLANAEKATPLHLALGMLANHAEQLTTIKELVNAGANPEIPDAEGDTALLCALRLGNAELVEFLLTRKVNLEAKDASGNTALHLAIHLKQFALARTLLVAGANPEALDAQSNNALLNAVKAQDLATVKDLILRQQGINLEAPDRNKNTALHLAAKVGNRDIALFLMEHGANAKALNNAAKRPEAVAEDAEHKELAFIIATKRREIKLKPLFQPWQEKFARQEEKIATQEKTLAEAQKIIQSLGVDNHPYRNIR